jgi:membrane-bound lytic murein transglycosylase B
MILVRPTVVSMVFAVQLAAAQVPPPVPPLPSSAPPFDVWLTELRAEAATRGISATLIEQALTGIEPAPQILERDRGQAEFSYDLDEYLKRRLDPATLRMARRMHTRHRQLATRVSRKYGVPAPMLIAVWGLESNFGRFAGVRPTIAALATLAYDPRRGPMFRNELFNALEIVDRGDITLEQLKGSWAGALGQPQFMPSSYLLYAQDFDGDGRRNIWTSQGDVFASIAYFLQQHGWTAGQAWGREVKLTAEARKAVDALPRRQEGCRAQRVMIEARPLGEWRRLGVRTTANHPVPSGRMPASMVIAGARTFLAYGNYDALLSYNCSHNYALSVALLGDRLR